ncbi:MAG: pitrilysin family protein [Candidatus Jorgensenbacteria bacterium]
MKHYSGSKLENGLTVITSEDKNSEVVLLMAGFKAGSRYEKKNERGYAHLLEHVLLKGTKKRPSITKVGEITDQAGADLGAYTDMESVVVRLHAAKEWREGMFELLLDVIGNPLFSTETLKNEKNIVIQELHKFRDNRGPRLWSESLKRLFGSHPLAQNPIGEEEVICHVTSAKLKSYYERFLTPDRGVIIATGNVSHAEIVKWVSQYGKPKWMQSRGASTPLISVHPKSGTEFIKEPGNQTQLFFNFVCPALTLNKLLTLELIANAFGYGNVPILKQDLRHKRGLVYAISSYVQRFQDVVLFYVSTASTEPKEVVEAVVKIFENFLDTFPESRFEEFKKKYKSVFLRKLSDPFYEANLLKDSWMFYGRLVTPEEISQNIESLTYHDVVNMRNRYLINEKLFITMFGERNPEIKLSGQRQFTSHS